MSHLTVDTWHLYSGDPLLFTITVRSDAAAADVAAAEWRHPDVTTITLAGGGITVSDDSNGRIVVDGDAGAPALTAPATVEAHLLLDTGAGLQVVATQRVEASQRVA